MGRGIILRQICQEEFYFLKITPVVGTVIFI